MPIKDVVEAKKKKRVYERYVKPLTQKIYKLEELSLSDELLLEDVLLSITEHSMDFEKLKVDLKGVTDVQRALLKKHGMEKEFQNALKFFSNME